VCLREGSSPEKLISGDDDRRKTMRNEAVMNILHKTPCERCPSVLIWL
jgi:hypothetical protein